MTSEIKPVSAQQVANRLGFWSALLTVVLATAAFAAAISTPPRSGPFCVSSCIAYPYINVASFVPRDYLWMVPEIFLTPLFVVLMACIHNYADEDKKVCSQIALSFALLSAAVITTDYFIQLTVMQPSLLKGETEGLSLFSQYNPHGIFIALEDLGYLMMSVAFLFAALVFNPHERLERALRRFFVISSLLSLGLFLALTLVYGNELEYRFEVTILTINWITLIVSGVLLSILFRRVWKYKGV